MTFIPPVYIVYDGFVKHRTTKAFVVLQEMI